MISVAELSSATEGEFPNRYQGLINPVTELPVGVRKDSFAHDVIAYSNWPKQRTLFSPPRDAWVVLHPLHGLIVLDQAPGEIKKLANGLYRTHNSTAVAHVLQNTHTINTPFPPEHIIRAIGRVRDPYGPVVCIGVDREHKTYVFDAGNGKEILAYSNLGGNELVLMNIGVDLKRTVATLDKTIAAGRVVQALEADMSTKIVQNATKESVMKQVMIQGASAGAAGIALSNTRDLIATKIDAMRVGPAKLILKQLIEQPAAMGALGIGLHYAIPVFKDKLPSNLQSIADRASKELGARGVQYMVEGYGQQIIEHVKGFLTDYSTQIKAIEAPAEILHAAEKLDAERVSR